MVRHYKAIHRVLPTNCFSVFDHFVSHDVVLTLKRRRVSTGKITDEACNKSKLASEGRAKIKFINKPDILQLRETSKISVFLDIFKEFISIKNLIDHNC